MKVHIQKSILDRAIEYISPRAGLRRMRSKAMSAVLGGYIGGRYDRNDTRQFFTAANSADVDTIFDLPTLRARSRDMVRNSPLATGAVGTMLTNVVGSGLTLMARPDGKVLGIEDEEMQAWTETTEHEFRLWAETPECDICRTQNFYALQGLVFRSVLESGDTFSLLPMTTATQNNPYSLRIQIIEADRVDSPRGTGITQLPSASGSPDVKPGNRIAGGVEIDEFGAPVAYHVMSHHPGDVAFAERTWTRVPAFGSKTGRRNVLHVYDKMRPGQSRGVPYLAPVIAPLKQLERYTDAELMAAVLGAMFTVFVKTETAEDGLQGAVSVEGPGTLQETGSGGNSNAGAKVDPKFNVGLGHGSIIDLAPGEDVSFADPKRPNTAFDGFVESILRQIGVALGLPFEVLIKHFTASYSAARAALLEAWRVFKLRRDFLATSFCAPVYEAWMEEAIALGRIQAPGFFDDPAIRRAYLQADWVGDAPGQIDPLKEIQASQLRIQTGVSSLQAETLALTGRLWADVNNEQEQEKEVREANGLQLPLVAPLPAGSGKPGDPNNAVPGRPAPAPADPEKSGGGPAK